MSTLRYLMADPTGNITLLAEMPSSGIDLPACAGALLAREKSGEQVGFLSPGSAASDIRLRMAGGEFCGNATLSAAAVRARELDLPAGETRTLYVEVAGTAAPLPVKISAKADNSYYGVVEMPLPLSVGRRRLMYDGQSYDLPSVRFPGIEHLIINGHMPRQTAEQAARLWCRELGTPALGLMLLGPFSSLTPLVYVPALGTLVWEHSCASGSAAVGAFTAMEQGSCRLSLREPGGTLRISAERAGDALLSLQLGGRILLGPWQSTELPVFGT